jgi:NADPH:quinone reductase-like Zn-dependent oxidoreductase
LAVQIAKARGAHVIATASRAKRAFVERLGADEVIDYGQVDFAETVTDVDVVMDLVGGDYGERSLRVLKQGGVLVTAVDPMNADLARHAELADVRFAGIMVEPDHVTLENLSELVETGRLTVHLDRAFPLEDIAEAHRLIESGHATGKVVVVL